MNASRTLPLLGVIALLSTPARALWSPVPASDTLWKRALVAPVLLVRTGDARLDDALEEGFRQSWRGTTWSWAPDSGIASVAKDTSVLVFYLAENWSRVRRSREEDCSKLTLAAAAAACRDDQTRAFFILYLTGKSLGLRDGAWLLTEPSQVRQIPRGDAMAIDIVRDFALAVQAVRDSAYPGEGPLEGDVAWARETIVRSRRSEVPRDTLWVLREQSGKVSDSALSAAFGGVVKAIRADSLEDMMGTSRSGSYLEAGLRPAYRRQLRVRDLPTGDLRLIDDRRPNSVADTSLRIDDFRRLAHRVRGEEYRMAWMASVGYEYSTAGLFGWTFLGGKEVRRGVWALAGWTSQHPALSSGGREAAELGQGTVILGARWNPGLDWEEEFLGPNLGLGVRYWQPVGGVPKGRSGQTLELAPHATLDLDYLGKFWFVGLSLETWFGRNEYKEVYESNGYDTYYETGVESDVVGQGGLALRTGFHFGIPDWKPAPSWRSAREVARGRKEAASGRKR